MKIIKLNDRVKCLLISLIGDYLDKNKKIIKTNRIIRSDYSYLRKLYYKLTAKGKRCSKCHQLVN